MKSNIIILERGSGGGVGIICYVSDNYLLESKKLVTKGPQSSFRTNMVSTQTRPIVICHPIPSGLHFTFPYLFNNASDWTPNSREVVALNKKCFKALSQYCEKSLLPTYLHHARSSHCLPVCPDALARFPLGRMFAKFDTGGFYEYLPIRSKVGWNRAKISGIFREELSKFYPSRRHKYAIKALLWNTQCFYFVNSNA